MPTLITSQLTVIHYSVDRLMILSLTCCINQMKMLFVDVLFIHQICGLFTVLLLRIYK